MHLSPRETPDLVFYRQALVRMRLFLKVRTTLTRVLGRCPALRRLIWYFPPCSDRYSP